MPQMTLRDDHEVRAPLAPLPTAELVNRARDRARSQAARETLEVMRAVTRAWQAGDADHLRALLHPAGEWTFTCDGDELFSDPDAFVDAIRRAQTETIYRMEDTSLTPLGDTVVLGAAFVRRPYAGGHAVDRHHWLCEVRDGLFFRSTAFRHEQHALAAFADGWADGHATRSSG